MKTFIRNFHQIKGIILFCCLGSIVSFYIGLSTTNTYVAGFFSNMAASFFYAIITLLIIDGYLTKRKHEEFGVVYELIAKQIHACIGVFMQETFALYKIYPSKRLSMKKKRSQYFTPQNQATYLFFQDIVVVKIRNNYLTLTEQEKKIFKNALETLEAGLNTLIDTYISLLFPKALELLIELRSNAEAVRQILEKSSSSHKDKALMKQFLENLLFNYRMST